MTCQELIQTVRTHPAVTSSVPLEAEMQWPRLMWESGTLYVQFLFCYTEINEQILRIEPPRYLVKLDYPFQRVVLLKDLRCRQESRPCPPSNVELTEKIQARIRDTGKALFRTIDTILSRFEERGDVESTLLAEQDRLLKQLVPQEQQAFYFDPVQGGVAPCG